MERRLGPYVIESELGRGGMGVVWRARDPEGGGPVAIKTIAVSALTAGRSPVDSEEASVAVERFRREARSLERVVHPNITRLLDSGAERGTAYLVFELVEGSSLDRRLRTEGPLPWAEVARLGAQVARALGAVHAAGLVHRDVKPANILLTKDGVAKLADFGLVRALGEQDSLAGTLTQEGGIVGTPQFLAPEQLERSSEIGFATDLYALGGTLFALLAGAPPFSGSGVELLRRHLLDAPPLPSSRVKGVPPALDRLVQRLLAKDPEKRGANAEAVASELEAIATGAPLPRSRGRAARIGGALAALLLAGGAFVALRPRAPVPGEPPAPPRPASPPEETVAPLDTRPPGPLVAAGQLDPDGPWRHADPVDALALAPSGRIVVTAGGLHERSLRAWNVKTLETLWTIRFGAVDGDQVYSVAIAPDDKRVLAGSRTGALRLFDMKDGSLLGELLPGGAWVTGTAFLDERTAVVARLDGTIQVWDVESPKPVSEAKAPELTYALAVERSPPFATTGGDGQTVRLWTLPDLQPAGQFDGSPATRALVFTGEAGERAIVNGGLSGHLSMHWARTLETTLAFEKDDAYGQVHALASREDGVVVDGRDDGQGSGSVQLWRTAGAASERRWRVAASVKTGAHVTGLAILPDGRILETSWDRHVRLFEEKGGRLEERSFALAGPRGACAAVAAPGDAEVVAACSVDDLIAGDPTKPGVIERRKGHKAPVLAVAAWKDRVFSGDGAGVVLAWTRGAPPVTLAQAGGWIASMAVSPAGDRLATITWDGQLLLTDLRTGASRKRATGTQVAGSVSWDKDGKRIVYSALRSRIAAWVLDADGDAPPRELPIPSDEKPETEWRAFATFSPDGREVIAAALHGPIVRFDLGAADPKPVVWLDRRWVVALEWLDATHCALVDGFGQIDGYELGASEPFTRAEIRSRYDHAISLAVRGRRLFVGTARGAVLRYDFSPR